MQKTLVFGAGQNGRGLPGRQAILAGHDVIFVDSYPGPIKTVTNPDGYEVDVAYLEGIKPLKLKGARGYCSAELSNKALIIEEIANSDLIFTAVGKDNLGGIAGLLEAGLEYFLRNNNGFKNILFCENQEGTASKFRNEYLRTFFTFHPQAEKRIGLVDAVVHIMSTTREGRLVSEGYTWLPIDAEAIRGTIDFPDIQPKENFHRYWLRKIFGHNAWHTAFGYSAAQEGLTSMADLPFYPIHSFAVGVSEQIISGLAIEFYEENKDSDFTIDNLTKHRDEIFKRITNKHLGDNVERLTSKVISYLAPNDRLIGPAKLLMKYGLPVDRVVTSIGNALHFDETEIGKRSEQGKKLAGLKANKGLPYVLENICGLSRDKDDSLFGLIERRYQELK